MSLQERTYFLSFSYGDGTMGLDSRVMCSVGISNMVFILKNARKICRKKNKRASPQGGSFLIQRQTREIFRKWLEHRETGACSFLKWRQKPLPSVVLNAWPLPLFQLLLQSRASETLPVSQWNPLRWNIDRIFRESPGAEVIRVELCRTMLG